MGDESNTSDEDEERQNQDSTWTLTMHVLSSLQVDLRALLGWPMDIPVVIFYVWINERSLVHPETTFIIEMRVYTDAT